MDSGLFAGLGINPTLLIAQAVNFLLVLWLLNRFVFKKVLSFLEERKSRIERGVQLTGKAEREMERIGEARTRSLQKARGEVERMLLAAKAQGIETEKEAVERSRVLTQELLVKAQAEAERKKRDALLSAQEEMRKSAFLLAEKVLARSLTSEDEERMGDELVKEIKQHHG